MTSKGPLNYTTTVDPDKTALECIGLLRKHRATHVGIAFGDDQEPDGIEFVVRTAWGPQNYVLPVNVAGVEKALKAAWHKRLIEPRFTSREQAARVAWRQVKDWLEAQLALIESGQAELAQVMLPYERTEGGTLWAAIVETRTRAIEAATGDSR
jgi:hypothetical protein